MSEPGYDIVSLAGLEAFPSPNHGDSRLKPLRQRLGLRAFGANCWTAEVGNRIVPEHEEDSGDEELYVVVQGRATFTVDGTELDAPAGTLVHLRPGEHRWAVAEEPETFVLAVGATPGIAYERRGWDDVVVAFALGRSGRVAEGRALMRDLPEHEGYAWGLQYNLACFEAQFGDRDLAIEHLRQAFELSPDDAARWAAHDTDLDDLRDDPRWQEIVG